MQGSIRQRSKGSWEIIWELPRGVDGKRQPRSLTVRGTKKEAQSKLTEILRSIDTGDYVEPTKLTVAAYLDRWLNDYAKTNVTPKTFEAYRNHIHAQIIPALGSRLLARLSPLDVQTAYTKWMESGRLRGEGGLSSQTVLHYHRILHKAFSQAVKWQLVARNVCDAVEPPRPQHQDMNAIDEEQTARLLRAVEGTRMHLPILLAIGTGMRRGELLALRWSDLELDRGLLSVRQSLEQTTGNLRFKPPKTAKGRRVVALPSFLVEALVRHKGTQSEHRLRMGPGWQDHGLVVCRPDGTPVRPDRFSQDFTDLIRRHELPRVRLHDLRHSHATQLFKAGVHPKIVSERLGHSTVGITLDTYSHVMPGMQEDAAQRLDIALRGAMEGGR